MQKAKGYCLKCKNATDAERVFEVPLDRKNCFCPNCLAIHDPAEVVKTYEEVLDHKILLASKKFLKEYDFENAYHAFASVIEIDDEYVPAYLWRIVCLVCLSTIRRSTFNEANDLFLSEVDKFKQFYDLDTFSIFVSRIINTTSYYLYKFKKRTAHKKYFYEPECVSLYYQRCNEILTLLRSIRDLFASQNEEVSNNKSKQVLKSLDNHIDDLNAILENELATVDGSIYKLARFMDGGQAIISKEKNVRASRIPPAAIKTLDVKNKKRIIIEDSLFMKHNKLYRIRIFELIFFPVLFILSGLFITLMFLNNFVDYRWIVYLSVGVTLFLFGLSMLSHSFYCSYKTKRLKRWLF